MIRMVNNNFRPCLSPWIGALACSLSIPHFVPAQETDKGAPFPEADDSGYTFLVGGHTYGIPGGGADNGIYPPFLNTLQKREGDLFMVLTGDIVQKSIPASWDAVLAQLQPSLPPAYFVMGNHDASEYATELFTEKFGGDYYSFDVHTERFIVLNAQHSPKSVHGEQTAFLRGKLEDSPGIRNFFIFTHEVLWKQHARYGRVTINSNANVENYNFWVDLFPLLKLQPRKGIYWIAGDVGVPWADPAAYDQLGNIHLIASGMGGNKEENFLEIQVQDGDVRIQAIPLGSGKISREIAWYSVGNMVNWKPQAPSGQPQGKAAWRLDNPGQKLKRLLQDKKFYIGFIFALFLVFVYQASQAYWKNNQSS